MYLIHLSKRVFFLYTSINATTYKLIEFSTSMRIHIQNIIIVLINFVKFIIFG